MPENPLSIAMQHGELTEKIIGCAFRVYNRMGHGFLESVYERCLLIELRKSGLNFGEKGVQVERKLRALPTNPS